VSKNGQDLTLRKYFLHDRHGNVTEARWWNGNAYVVDFTNPDAGHWFADQLRRLQKVFSKNFLFYDLN
jgi:alpha-D-xyloside xylohydrolase